MQIDVLNGKEKTEIASKENNISESVVKRKQPLNGDKFVLIKSLMQFAGNSAIKRHDDESLTFDSKLIIEKPIAGSVDTLIDNQEYSMLNVRYRRNTLPVCRMEGMEAIRITKNRRMIWNLLNIIIRDETRTSDDENSFRHKDHLTNWIMLLKRYVDLYNERVPNNIKLNIGGSLSSDHIYTSTLGHNTAGIILGKTTEENEYMRFFPYNICRSASNYDNYRYLENSRENIAGPVIKIVSVPSPPSNQNRDCLLQKQTVVVELPNNDLDVKSMSEIAVNKGSLIKYERPASTVINIIPNQLCLSNSLESLTEIHCRVCHSNGNEKLISPCHCNGTLKYVHESCLVTWMKNPFKEACEICRKEIHIVKKRKPILQWKLPAQRPTPLFWVLVFATAICVNFMSVVKDAARQCVTTSCIVFYIIGSIGIILASMFLYFWIKRVKLFFKYWMVQNEHWVVKLEEDV